MWIDRRLMVGAAASLLLNALLIGVVVGHVVGARRPAPGAPAGPLVRLHALSADDRRLFFTSMAPHRPAIRAARAAHRAARQTVEDDIAAPTFDRAKVDADFATLRGANAHLDETLDGALTDALAHLSPEARAAMIVRAGREKR
jgi:uncharacterized membrane protein